MPAEEIERLRSDVATQRMELTSQSRVISDHVTRCANQFKAMIAVVLVASGGFATFLNNMSRDVVALQQSLQYMIETAKREHDELIVWQRDQSTLAAENRKVIDSLQQQIWEQRGQNGIRKPPT